MECLSIPNRWQYGEHKASKLVKQIICSSTIIIDYNEWFMQSSVDWGKRKKMHRYASKKSGWSPQTSLKVGTIVTVGIATELARAGVTYHITVINLPPQQIHSLQTSWRPLILLNQYLASYGSPWIPHHNGITNYNHRLAGPCINSHRPVSWGNKTTIQGSRGIAK